VGYAKHAISLSLIALICACATPHYSRKTLNRATFEQLDSNIVRVSFNEGHPTYREDLEKDLIYSCAKLTTNEGYDYFIIIGGDLSSTPLLYSQTRTRYYRSPSSQYPNGNIIYSSYSTSTYYESGDTVHDGQAKATAIIQMFKKPRPPKLWYAYDARELTNNLRPPG